MRSVAPLFAESRLDKRRSRCPPANRSPVGVFDCNDSDIVTGVNAPLKPCWSARSSGQPTLKDSNYSANTNAHLVSYFLNRKPGASQPHHFIAIEDPTRAPNCIPGLRAMGLGGFHPSADPFANQFPFKLRDCREDMQQELARRVRFVRVEALRGGDETNPEARQFLNARDAVHERAAETVKFPDDYDVEFPASGIRHQLIQPRTRSFRPAHLVLVDGGQFPPAALDVFLQFTDLDGVVLVDGGNPGVDGCDFIYTPAALII